jgi:cyclohexanecarboxyl-CoA dehydrogenase
VDLDFTGDQRAFRDAVADFARSELAPHSAEWDETGAFPREVVARMADMGLVGIRLPPEHGGQGADCVTTGIACEEVAAADFSAGYYVLMPTLVGEIIAAAASPAQRARWLPRIAAGASIPALALTEPHAGSDARAMALRAEPHGDAYVLRGEKTSVSLGEVADVALVFAKAPGGVVALVVDLDTPGIARQRFTDLGTRAIGRAAFSFDGAAVPMDDRLGEEGDGFRLVMRGFDYSRALIALMCLGAAREAISDAIAYANDRSAFGRPLIANQGVAFPLVEHSTYIEAARLLSYRALWLKDAGRPHTIEANMAKWWAPRLAVDAIHQALLFHGHMGYSDEVPQGRRLRDVIGLEIGDGTAEIAKSVVAREMFGVKPY